MTAVTIRRALLSVSDKTGLVELGQVLADRGVELVSTGGTAKATCDLVSQLGGEVHAVACLIELLVLNGRAKLAGQRLHSVLQY